MSASNPTPEQIAAQMSLDHMICFAAYSTSQAMNRFYRPILDEMGLTYPQFVVMMVLWENGQATMKSLSERVFLESNTLTPLLKKLEAAGLVTRARNKQDERILDIKATDRGMALKQRGCMAPVELAAATGETLEGVIDLQQRLTRMRNALNEKASG